VISILEDNSLSWPKELTLVAPHLEEAPFVEFCGDIMMHSNTPSTGLIDLVCNEPLELILQFISFTSHHPVLCACLL